uniref:Protein SEC13 homolog n=1 Tax=Rhabditophanes sp. KR3021 TaxID=114890 RepID=A0AC35TGH7_9BILA
MPTSFSKIDTGHRDIVHDAQMHRHGTRLATASSDRMVRIFDVKSEGNGTQISELAGHDGPVWKVAWAPTKSEYMLASCSYDKKVIIWKEIGGAWVKSYEYGQHENSVNCIAWAPYQYGLTLLAGSTDGKISILELIDGKWQFFTIENAHENGVNGVAWAPYGLSNFGGDGMEQKVIGKRFVTCGSDNKVKVWSFNTSIDKYEVESELLGHTDWVRDVAWGAFTCDSIAKIVSADQGKNILLWTCDFDKDEKVWSKKDFGQMDEMITNVSFSQLGDTICASAGDGQVKLWKNIGAEWIEINPKSKDAPPSSRNSN